eukprot:31454-Pelagococcus_subviridis.AAC.15
MGLTERASRRESYGYFSLRRAVFGKITSPEGSSLTEMPIRMRVGSPSAFFSENLLCNLSRSWPIPSPPPTTDPKPDVDRVARRRRFRGPPRRGRIGPRVVLDEDRSTTGVIARRASLRASGRGAESRRQ